MKCLSLNEEIVDWKLKSTPRKNASKAHKLVISVLREMFPGMVLFEECKIPLGKGSPTLYVDIFVPTFMLMIEVDGAHHKTYNQFFHKDMMTFLKQKRNDATKEEWCELNNIKLLRIEDGTNSDNCRLQICAALPQRKAGQI